MGYAPVCQVKRCGDKTSVRLEGGGKRRDLCLAHTFIAIREWSEDDVEILDTWNGVTEENVKNGLSQLKELLGS